jgi:hypothetical protein
MDDKHYVTPGWIAIAAAALTLPVIVLSILLDVLARKNSDLAVTLLLPYVGVVSAQLVCGVYALIRLKTLLNERHGFHDVDGLIVAMVLGACLLTLVGTIGRVSFVFAAVGTRPLSMIVIALFVVVGIPLSILSIVFAVRLLRLESDLWGLLKPFAYTTIAAAALMMTLLLAPIGMLFDAAANVMLGMIFLKQASGPRVPDFV